MYLETDENRPSMTKPHPQCRDNADANGEPMAESDHDSPNPEPHVEDDRGNGPDASLDDADEARENEPEEDDALPVVAEPMDAGPPNPSRTPSIEQAGAVLGGSIALALLLRSGQEGGGGGLEDSSRGLGFPVAAAITATASIASTVLPHVLGGDPAAERAEAVAGLQQLQARLKSDIAQVQREAADWTRVEAQQRLDRNGSITRNTAFSRYFAITSGADHPAAEQLAAKAAEALRTTVTQAAETRVGMLALRDNAPALIGGAAGLVGGGLLLWNAVRDGDTEDEAAD